jgi:hypothetical protein
VVSCCRELTFVEFKCTRSAPQNTLGRRSAEVIERICKVDPVVCPRCQDEMRIIAVLVDHDDGGAVLRHPSKTDERSSRFPPTPKTVSAAP